ncbi:MAG: hypothetical protein ABI045_06980 [Flavobacteriales bacterium]
MRKYVELVQLFIPVVRVELLKLLNIYSIQGAKQFKYLIEILEPIIPRLHSISSSP